MTSDFQKRLIVATPLGLGVPIFTYLASEFWPMLVIYKLAIAALITFCVFEWLQLTAGKFRIKRIGGKDVDHSGRVYPADWIALIAWLAINLFFMFYIWIAILLATVATVLIIWRDRGKGGRPKRAWFALGLPYMAIAGSVLVLTLESAGGFWIVLYVAGVAVVTDTGASQIGKSIRSPKLAPKLSPGKTWAGAIGGVVIAIMVVWLFVEFVVPERIAPDLLPLLGYTAFLSVVSQLGDLLFSWVKRRFKTKDFGAALGAHGGLCDRFDSHFAVWWMHGVVLLAGGGPLIWPM